VLGIGFSSSLISVNVEGLSTVALV